MTLRIALDIAPATETHCGTLVMGCPKLTVGACAAFGDGLKYDRVEGSYKRLAACIKATLPAEPWTEQRPTEAGEYEVSRAPHTRNDKEPAAHAAKVFCRNGIDGLRVRIGEGEWALSSGIFDGARWRKRDLPADPFAKEPTC